MFSLFKIKEQKAVLREEAVAVLQQARCAAQRTVEHTAALGQLFSEEVRDYAGVQAKRVVMGIVACIMLLSAYFLFCAALAVVLHYWLGLAEALGIVCALNLLVAIALLWRVKTLSGKALAPATVEELKNDWQCLKLLCKGNKTP